MKATYVLLEELSCSNMSDNTIKQYPCRYKSVITRPLDNMPRGNLNPFISASSIMSCGLTVLDGLRASTSLGVIVSQAQDRWRERLQKVMITVSLSATFLILLLGDLLPLPLPICDIFCHASWSFRVSVTLARVTRFFFITFTQVSFNGRRRKRSVVVGLVPGLGTGGFATV